MSRNIRPEQELATVAAVRAQIAKLTDDEEAIRDTLEGEIDIDRLMARLIADYREREAEMTANDALAKLYAERKKAAEEAASKRKGLLLHALDLLGQAKWKTAIGTVSRVEGREKAEIDDKALVPDDFLIPQDPKIDAKALLKALQDGDEVPGAHLGRGDPFVMIR